MAWLADLAGKAESLLNNLDEQTGAALRNHNGTKKKNDRSEHSLAPENPSSANQRRRPFRSLRKVPQFTETRFTNYNGPRRPVPGFRQSKPQTKESNEKLSKTSGPSKRNSSPPNRNPAKITSGDIRNNDIDKLGLKNRRYSLPSDLEFVQKDDFIYKLQNVEVENTMLKNELNVMNREVSELLNRLRRTEDGNDVVSDKELKETVMKLEEKDVINSRFEADNYALTSQMDLLKKKINDLMIEEGMKNSERNNYLELEVKLLQSRNKELEDLIRQLNEKYAQQETNQTKLENELRHAQTTIQELESNGEKISGECRRLERDWDAYKLRVKNMLQVKDKEIKSLQEGLNLTEDTKILIDQIETLKQEREELSGAVSRVHGECSEMRRQMERVEERHRAAERVVQALREALRDERNARTLADNRNVALVKDLKTLQSETDQTITVLRTALHEKDSEIQRLRHEMVRTPDTSALNVADYGDAQDTMDSEKIQYLTQTLVQRQEKIESLLADNNVLRIQMDKLESKYKAELSSLRVSQKHSVVHVQDENRTRRGRITGPIATGFSRVVGVTFRRHPLFRTFVLFYMVGLHFWVLTVLFTSTPESYNFLKTKTQV